MILYGKRKPDFFPRLRDRDRKAYLRIGKKVAIDEMSGEISMGGNWDIWLRGLEVEASYVAAGMFAACQDSDYLSAHFRRGINTDNPGVGYRFSEEANAEGKAPLP